MNLEEAYIHLISGLAANSELYRREKAKYAELRENNDTDSSFNKFYSLELCIMADSILDSIDFKGDQT